MGNSSAGKPVNERSAMQITAVCACVRVISEAIASLPLHLYKYSGDGNSEKATDHHLYFLLHSEPNPEMTSFVFRETIMTHLLLWGNAYAQIIRNGKGEVVSLYPLAPNRMRVERNEEGQLYYVYTKTTDDPDQKESETTYVLMPSDVLHIPGISFDGIIGFSPIAMAKNAIGLAIATETYGSKFFANGATPSGILEHPGTIKDPQKVRDAWMSQFGGSSNSNKVAVLEEGMKYTPMNIIVTVPAIAAIVYTLIDIVKTACGGDEKFKRFIPLIAATLGAVISVIAFYFVPGVLETGNVLVAIVIGAASGLSATGTNQAVKQLVKSESKAEEGDETDDEQGTGF